ncbi:dual specificity tyrosine-phosphorylation-regulated kinase mbk-2 isoform X2 [Folsomia candida]|uniref:dual specificity tyrosine-phosphorylation-regulated kinase mbk-2 isoform X2 n=1 Tax=Folsomia candida TaxID=158441 RepID=UPI000B8F8BD6|nr:dual specificity tyrosine-phosphorylation-regulated kinase mbk-2 isoform X2 [Folsomia candida]
MNNKYPKMSESSKLKHSYSLTSLSTRFLNGNSLHNGHHTAHHPPPHHVTSSSSGGLGLSNGNQQHNHHHQNHHHQSMLMPPGNNNNNAHVTKDSLDNMEGGSDGDYGFLSFRDQPDFRDSSSTLTNGTCSSKPSGLLRNSSFYSTSTSYLNLSNGGSNSNSSFTTTTTTPARLQHHHQQQPPLSISQMQHLQQPHGHNNNNSSSSLLLNGMNGVNTPGGLSTTGRVGSASINTKQQKCTTTGSGNMSMCGCDCHGGLKLSKTEIFRNNFNAKRDASNNLKSNTASSCQTLNLCSTTNSSNSCNGNHHHNNHVGLGNGNSTNNNNSVSSIYGNMYGSTTTTSTTTMNNNSSSNPNAGPDVHNNNNHPNTNGMSILGVGVENRKNPSVRVRRTLSCYAKNPSRNDILENNLTSSKEFTGSVNVVANCGNGNVSYQPNFTNPICEFSPYSSLSSNDLLGLRLSNGYIDKRYASVSNGNGHGGLTTVFFHDNPVDCGCPTCFQMKLTIFQANQKKQPIPSVVNNNNSSSNGSSSNKDDSGTTTSPISNKTTTIVSSNNALSYSTTSANYSCKTQDSDIISWPLTPEAAVGYFASRLTSWELSEISKYPQSWYLGQDAVRKISGEKTNPLNAGYDDENGNYHKVTRDHLAYRYEILEVIGKGSFGQVIKAIDHKTQSQVAIKIIRNKKRFHAQALVEVKILEHLRKRDHDNTVIRMFSSFYFRNHLCIVFELMSLNLYELIRRNHYQGFSTGLIRKFAVSLLKCLALLKKENIIHCDLKPENILLRRRGSSAIKVIDFGSSCFVVQPVVSPSMSSHNFVLDG